MKRINREGVIVVNGVTIVVRKGKGDAVWFETPNGEPIELAHPKAAGTREPGLFAIPNHG